MIKAISFDLWDTVIHDDSDEPKRKAQGLRTKREERRHLVWEALNAESPTDRDLVFAAYNVMETAFNIVWKKHSVTWTVKQRMDVLLQGLGRELDEKRLRRVITDHEMMELDVAPDPIPGVGEALEALAKKYKLVVVSDAIVSPGSVLRTWLDKHGLEQHFSGFAFSDEVGHSKPHHTMFESAAAQVGVELTEMVHIGDRDHNDIKGPQALGMKAILFTATRPADKDTTSADAICESYDQLPGIIEKLAAS